MRMKTTLAISIRDLIVESASHLDVLGTLTVAEPLILKNVDYNVIFLSNFLS